MYSSTSERNRKAYPKPNLIPKPNPNPDILPIYYWSGVLLLPPHSSSKICKGGGISIISYRFSRPDCTSFVLFCRDAGRPDIGDISVVIVVRPSLVPFDLIVSSRRRENGKTNARSVSDRRHRIRRHREGESHSVDQVPRQVQG